jgi:hypothetical protein
MGYALHMSIRRSGEMRKALVLGVIALAGTLASPAFADEWSGVRLGLNLSSEKLQSDLFFAPLVATESINEQRFGYGLMGGWALNKWLAVEGSLQSGTEFNSSVFEPLMTAPEDFVVSHTNVKGAEITAVGSYWITNKFAIFGRVGMYAWKAEETVAVGSYAIGEEGCTCFVPASKTTASADDTGFDPVFGIGLQTQLDGALVRLEYKQTEIGDLGLTGAFNLHDSEISSLQFSIVWIL